MSDWRQKQVERFAEADSENIAYDYFKSLVTLSLVTIGGIVTIGQGLFAETVSLDRLAWCVGLVASGGIVAFQGQLEIVRIAQGSSGSTWLRFAHYVSPLLFGMGAGIFLGALFLPSL